MTKDIMGVPLAVGQTVVHAQRQGNSGALEVRVVTEVGDGFVVLRPLGNPKAKGRAIYSLDRVAVVIN